MKVNVLIAACVGLATTGMAHAFNVEEGKVLQQPLAKTGIVIQTPERSAPVVLAQSAADVAVQNAQLQEQVRRLNGKVEELTFQLLQLQEQIRKMQEDNEFRFQELEEKHSDAGGAVKTSKPAIAQGSGGTRLGKSQPSEDMPRGNSSGGTNETIKEAGRILGAPPRTLGTLKFDTQGNVIDSAVGKPLDLVTPVTPNSNQFAEGVDVDNIKPGLLLARGRDYYDGGDYVSAERNLRALIKAYPEGKGRAEAQYWLGKSLFAKGDFHAAATTFLDTHNAYPDAKQAPDTLLLLGLSMAGLNHREIACATYAEVLKQYPGASAKVRKQVARERDAAGC